MACYNICSTDNMQRLVYGAVFMAVIEYGIGWRRGGRVLQPEMSNIENINLNKYSFGGCRYQASTPGDLQTGMSCWWSVLYWSNMLAQKFFVWLIGIMGWRRILHSYDGLTECEFSCKARFHNNPVIYVSMRRGVGMLWRWLFVRSQGGGFGKGVFTGPVEGEALDFQKQHTQQKVTAAKGRKERLK